MDLFIETRRQVPAAAPAQVPSERAEPERDAYSLQQESYRAELAFDKKRARRRKVLAVVRALALCIVVPVGLIAVFLASYVLTCIINGATPAEVVELLAGLAERVRGFVWQLMGT